MTNNTITDNGEFDKLFNEHKRAEITIRIDALYFYKAGLEQGKRIENEGCAEVCDKLVTQYKEDHMQSNDREDYGYLCGAIVISGAIRSRIKS